MPAKLIMLLVLSVAFLSSWFVVRWYLGNTIAEYFALEERRLETAQLAASWAPKDPLPLLATRQSDREGTPPGSDWAKRCSIREGR